MIRSTPLEPLVETINSGQAGIESLTRPGTSMVSSKAPPVSSYYNLHANKDKCSFLEIVYNTRNFSLHSLEIVVEVGELILLHQAESKTPFRLYYRINIEVLSD